MGIFKKHWLCHNCTKFKANNKVVKCSGMRDASFCIFYDPIAIRGEKEPLKEEVYMYTETCAKCSKWYESCGGWDYKNNPDFTCTLFKGKDAKPNRMTKDEYYLGVALAVSQRSTCLKRHYGCVIVKNDQIIATGYNGSPRGEQNCCDIGTCKRLDLPNNSGDYSNCHSVHAEQNAIIMADGDKLIGATMYLAGYECEPDDESGKTFSWVEINGCEPCPICARMISNSGIFNVINNVGHLVIEKLL